jgi:hypothetical protein
MVLDPAYAYLGSYILVLLAYARILFAVQEYLLTS